MPASSRPGAGQTPLAPGIIVQTQGAARCPQTVSTTSSQAGPRGEPLLRCSLVSAVKPSLFPGLVQLTAQRRLAPPPAAHSAAGDNAWGSPSPGCVSLRQPPI